MVPCDACVGGLHPPYETPGPGLRLLHNAFDTSPHIFQTASCGSRSPKVLAFDALMAPNTAMNVAPLEDSQQVRSELRPTPRGWQAIKFACRRRTGNNARIRWIAEATIEKFAHEHQNRPESDRHYAHIL